MFTEHMGQCVLSIYYSVFLAICTVFTEYIVLRFSEHMLQCEPSILYVVY